MANYNTIITAEEAIPCSVEKFEQLRDMLETAEDEDTYHGIECEYDEEKVYIFAPENGTPEELPGKALEFIGALIAEAGKPYLEFGYASTCGRLIPGSHGGGYFRIYADGSLVSARSVWPDEDPAGIAEELIDFVIQKYGVKSLDDFTCPIHRKLAVALGKFKG